MTDQVTFNATLEDNVSPNLQKLRRQLQEMGKSPVEIKMILQAVDESTPKIKAAQQQLDKLPKKHTTKWEITDTDGRPIHTALQSFTTAIRTAREEFAKPFKTPLTFVDEKGQHIGNAADHLFNVRSKVALPLMGSIPGSNMLYGVGAGAGIAGALTGVSGTMQDSFKINAQMEQQQQMLAQTLKDQQGASKEMQKVVAYAQTTPFQYQDVLRTNVILRNYGMPSMPGESKQMPQGYLKLASNMAAMMQTQPEDAAMALAEARQGLPRRLLMYGVHMEAKDFGPGGRFQGMSPDQALSVAGRKFQGSTQAQMQTFTGITSNIKDVMQQQIMKPIGQEIFKAVEQQAFHTADKLQTTDVQQKIGMAVEKVQHLTVEIIQNLAKVREYFETHLKTPIEEVISALTKLGRSFAMAFGGSSAIVVKTMADAVISIAEPLAALGKSVPILGQLFGYMKAMQMLGMGGASKPLQTLFGGMMPGSGQSMLTAPFKALFQLPGAAAKIGGFLIVKDLLDAHRATKDMNNEFSNAKGHLDEINARVSTMAMGLAESGTHMKNLVATAAQGIPTGRMAPQSRVDLALATAGASQRISNITGVGSSDIAQALDAQMKQSQNWTQSAMKDFGEQLIQLSAVAKEFKVSWSNAMRIMQEFAPQAGPVGLGGLGGAGALVGLASGVNQYGITRSQATQGFYTPDSVLQSMLSGYRNPTATDIQKIGIGNIPKYWGIGSNPGAISRYGINSAEYNREGQGGINAQNANRGMIGGLAPQALGALPTVPEPWMQNNLGVNFGSFKGSPTQVIEKVGAAWLRTADNVKQAGIQYGNAQAEVAKMQSKVETLTQAQQALDLQMQAFQHVITLAQRKVEDASLALQEYTFANLRPLERELTRVNNVMDIVNHTMSDAQYNMTKFADGLLTGEQAALNQLHALQLYNEQLNYLKLQYTQIGAQLGTRVYERGYSARVQPLMGLSLEMQSQQLQRRQQLAQSQYDITYGEGHYQMQQAQRTRFQRTEMPLDTRLQGIKQNQATIDNSTVQLHNLGNVQFQIQEKMFKVNEAIADQTDNITKLQIGVQKLQQSSTMRGLEDSQFNLAQATGKANLQITKQQSLASKWQNALTDLRQQAQDLQKLFASLLTFPGGGGPNAYRNARNAINEAAKIGLIPPQEKDFLLKQLSTAQQTAKQAGASSTNWYKDKPSWVDVIKRALIGFFTGDLWRKLGDIVKGIPGIGGPLSTGLHALGTVAPIMTLVATSLAAGGAITWALKRGLAKLIPDAVLSPIGKGFGALGSRLEGVPVIGGLGRAMGELDTPGGIRDKLAGGLFSTIKERFAPLLHPIQNFTRILGRGLGVGAGLLVSGGNPLVGALGGILGGKVAGSRETPIRDAKNVAKEVASEIKHPVSTMEKAAQHVKDAAAREGRTAVSNARSAVRNGHTSDRIHAAADRVKEVVHKEGEHVKAFGDHVGGKGFWGGVREFTSEHKGIGKFSTAVGIISIAAELFSNNVKDLVKMIGHFFHIGDGPHGAPKVPDHLNTGPESDASRLKQLAERSPVAKAAISRAIRAGSKTVEIGGKVFSLAAKTLGALGFVPAALDLAQGHVGKAAGEAANAGSYFVPVLGESRVAADVLNLIIGKGSPNRPVTAAGRVPGLNTTSGMFSTRTGSGTQSIGNIFATEYSSLLDHIKKTKYTSDKARDDDLRNLRKYQLSAIRVQTEFNSLDQTQKDKYYQLTNAQQQQAQKAALTGSNGLQDFLKQSNDHLNTHWQKRVQAIATGYTNENRTHSAGYKAISTTTGGWLTALTKQIDTWSKQNGLPLTKTTAGQGVAAVSNVVAGAVSAVGNVSNLFQGFETGGLVDADPHKIGPGRIVRMVEEGHPEMVIPLAPHRRDRAKQLINQTKGLLGYAGGGVVTMYDDTGDGLHNIPKSAQAVASYVDNYGGYSKAKGMFPNAQVVSISVNPGNNLPADIYDVEPGGKSVSETVGAILSGKTKGAYGSASDLGSLQSALSAHHKARSAYKLWLSAWPGSGANVTSGYDAHQYAAPGAGSPGSYDLSKALPSFFGSAPASAPKSSSPSGLPPNIGGGLYGFGYTTGFDVGSGPQRETSNVGKIPVITQNETAPTGISTLRHHPHIKKTKAALDHVMKSLKRAAGGYVYPLPGFTLGQVDQGVDANAPAGTPILAFGDSKLVNVLQGWYSGQPLLDYQLLSGPDAGKYWYVAEQVTPVTEQIGATFKAGQAVGRYASSGTGIEIGWAGNASGETLTQATAPGQVATRHAGSGTDAGNAFNAFIRGLAHGKLVAGGPTGGTSQPVPPIHLKHPPDALKSMGLIGPKQWSILNKKRKAWEKHLNAMTTQGASGAGAGVPALPGGWFRVGATLDPTMGQAPTFDAHGGFSFAELLEAGTNAGMRPDLTQVLGLSRGGFGMPMETPILIRMPGGKTQYKIWKNDVGSGQAGDPHYKIDLHQAIANSLGWHGNQDVEIKKAATGFKGLVSRPTMFLAGEAGNEHVDITPDAKRGKKAKNPLAQDEGWIKFTDTFNRLHKSILNIEIDIHKVEKHLREDKTTQAKVRDTDILRQLNAELRHRTAQTAGAQQHYERTIAKDLLKVHDRSGGENTLAGVTDEQNRRNKMIDEAANHGRKLHHAETQLHKDQKKFSDLTKRVHEKGHHETNKERHELTTLRKHIHRDQQNISRITRQTASHARHEYVVGAAERGVNVGLMRAITGSGLNRHQTQAYDKLARAYLAAERSGSNKHSKAIQKLENQLGKTLTTTSKKTQDQHKKAAKYASDTHKAVQATLPHLKEAAKQAQASTARLSKANDDSNKHNNKHETHMSKTETHQKTLEKKLDSLLSKDTVVNITQNVTGAKVTTTRQPARKRAK